MCQIPSSILTVENLPSSIPEPEPDAETPTRVHVTLVSHVKLEMQKQHILAYFFPLRRQFAFLCNMVCIFVTVDEIYSYSFSTKQEVI
jgi:hypothetical protein